jgi:hypothetical protein
MVSLVIAGSNACSKRSAAYNLSPKTYTIIEVTSNKKAKNIK